MMMDGENKINKMEIKEEVIMKERNPPKLQIEQQPFKEQNQLQKEDDIILHEKRDQLNLLLPPNDEKVIQKVEIEKQIGQLKVIQEEKSPRQKQLEPAESVELDPEFNVPQYSLVNANNPLNDILPYNEQKKQESQIMKFLRVQEQRIKKERQRRQEQQLQASMALIKQLEQEQQKQKVEKMKRIMAEQQESIKLAKLLQREQALEMQEQEKKIQEKVICTICLMQIDYRQYDPLQKCGHMFHRQCISSYLLNQIQIRKFPIRCPLSECRVDLTDWDIRSRIDQDNREKYKKLTFQNFIQLNPDLVSCCPTPDCQNVFAFKEGVIEFRCTICNGHYCLDCKTNWHDGQTCQQFRISSNYSQQDKQFKKFVKGKNFKKCPKCKFWVERTEGCDHMTCRCGAQFCYQCGGPYKRCKCRGFDIGQLDDDQQ